MFVRDALTRGLFGLLSPGGPNGRLQTLIFHRVLPERDPLFPDEMDARRFDALCGWLAAWFNVLPLDEAVRRLRDGSLPPRAVAITFDDGYADNHDVALPILHRRGLSATFFIATGFLDGGRMWNDTVIEAVRRSPLTELPLDGWLEDGEPGLPARISLAGDVDRRACVDRLLPALKYLAPERRQAAVDELARRAGATLPDDLMMTSRQVRALRDAGMVLGAHTATHPILAILPDDRARAEIDGGRRQLEAILGERVGLFAYPNGKPDVDYTARSVRLVADLGFDAAVSTAWGVAAAGSDLLQLPRFTPWDARPAAFAIRLARNFSSAAVAVSRSG